MIDDFLEIIRSNFKRPTTPLLWLSLLCLLISGVALGFAVSRGARSNEWSPVTAEVAQGVFGGKQRNRYGWHRVRVSYTFNENPFQRSVHVFSDRSDIKKGNKLTVYVNPDRPAELTSQKGFLAIDYGPPLGVFCFSLAAAVVILCIKFSPKDDYESEVNDTLM